MKRHIPNILSILRLVLLLPFLLFLSEGKYNAAFYVFFIAGVSDGFDGFLARRWNCQTRLGFFLDPIADKLLVTFSFIALALLQQLPWWLVIIVFLRDVSISAGVLVWYWLIKHPIDFKPSLLSKCNTVVQLALITFCLFQLAWFYFPDWVYWSLVVLTSVTTISSYIDYIWIWGQKARMAKKQML